MNTRKQKIERKLYRRSGGNKSSLVVTLIDVLFL